MSTDEELAEAYARGERSAFDELFTRYRRSIFKYAYRMLGGRAPAEDACQEVFLRVHSRIGTYAVRSRFAAWIFTIAFNVCVDALRKRKRERWLRFGLPKREPGADSMIDRETIRNQLREMVLREIQKLGEKQREVFLLRAHGDLLFREIAEMLNIPLNTALVRYHQAVLHLKGALMKGECDDDNLQASGDTVLGVQR